MAQDNEASARERFQSYKNQEAVRCLREVVEARIENHRTRLERSGEDAEITRGRLKEDRDFLKLLSE